jgi:hypothetical protein
MPDKVIPSHISILYTFKLSISVERTSLYFRKVLFCTDNKYGFAYAPFMSIPAVDGHGAAIVDIDFLNLRIFPVM